MSKILGIDLGTSISKMAAIFEIDVPKSIPNILLIYLFY